MKWFNWKNVSEPFQSWDKLKSMLIKKYDITKVDSTLQKLLEIKQKGLVTKYHKEFKVLASIVGIL